MSFPYAAAVIVTQGTPKGGSRGPDGGCFITAAFLSAIALALGLIALILYLA